MLQGKNTETPAMKSAVGNIGNSETSQEKGQYTEDTADIRSTLIEARKSLTACLSDSNKTHYVVCIPGLSNTITVHNNFVDVVKLMKEHKNQCPRMMTFPSLADAEAFASNHTANEVCQGANIKSNYPQEKAEVELAELKLFPSLTTPQLNEFRMCLEKGNISTALERVLSNPRYLVQSVDLPTILKEGPRYNALHASVIAGQLESCRLVMEMISDVEYLKCLYETQKRAEENSKRLIDLYLNTPDKVANKTPLHLASERGFVDIVTFLVSFKACIRNFNHHIRETVKKGDKQIDQVLVTGETPEQVACSRCKGSNVASLKTKIIDLIQGGTCYVPLIRSDTTGPYAKVGEPYIPSSPYKLVSEIEDVFKPSPAAALDQDTKDFRNMKVWAFAGPMSPQEAEDFKKEWKSPRFKKTNYSIKENHKVMDGDRGFERFGRELADSHSTSWQEYWPFLDAFADLRSEEGLDKLELFFQKLHVLSLMQILLKTENFVPAAPYLVSQEYILRQELSDAEESEEENEVYFSAESPSCSEEDGYDSQEVFTTDADTSDDTPSVNITSKLSSGLFSSLWRGIVKLKNYFSPVSNKRKHSIRSTDSNDNNAKKSRSGIMEPEPYIDASSGANVHNTSLADSETQFCSDNNDESISDSFASSEACLPQTTAASNASDDVARTPDQWKYRSRLQSPESVTSSPEQECPSPSAHDVSLSSPANRGEKLETQDRTVNQDAPLDESFNTKMDSISQSLQHFYMLSPKASPPASAATTPSTPSSDSDADTEPTIHIFTGKMFSKLLSQLKFRKLLHTDIPNTDNYSRLPTLFLRQAEGSNTLLADLFLPGGMQEDQVSLLAPQGNILDEVAQREAIKNTWTNFLAAFSTSVQARKVASLTRDVISSAVIEGLPEEGDVCRFSSFSRVDHANLKELFIKSRDTLYESKHSVTLTVRIVRSSTLLNRDLFVCGTLPTKADADVYHTLNNKACQLIQKQPSRFCHVSRWYSLMKKQGNDCINSLPSPSRVLRSGKCLPQLVSPLVSERPRSHLLENPASGETPPVASDGHKTENPAMRNLFGH